MLNFIGLGLLFANAIFLPFVSTEGADGQNQMAPNGEMPIVESTEPDQRPVNPITPIDEDEPTTLDSVTFDDSDPALMVLSSSRYLVRFRKTNGSIASIEDPVSGEILSDGSNNECLWGTFETNFNSFAGGCGYSPTWGSRFTYTWDIEPPTLTFTYTHDPNFNGIDARVSVWPSDENHFDMQLELFNDWGFETEYVSFPTELQFSKAGIEDGFLPMSPGILLSPNFFAEDRSYLHRYPAPYVSDFIALTMRGSLLSLYSVVEPGEIQPLTLGFQNKDANTTIIYRSYYDLVPDQTTWRSPLTRIRVGGTLWEAAEDYRVAGQLDQMPSLSKKIKNKSLFRHLKQAPLLKADFGGLGLSYGQYETDVLPRLPSPAIFHPVTYWDDIFDQDYPDFHTPNLAYGSEAELSALFAKAGRYGQYVMPYINPTWWDSDSDTMQTLLNTADIREISVLDENGDPVYEFYGPNDGYVISPHVAVVRKALDRLLTTMMKKYYVDFFFEDQVGARPTMVDYSDQASSPTDYAEAWLAYTEDHPSPVLMTEGGYDRLAQTEAGFHSSILLSEVLGATDSWWGDDNWESIPFATAMLRDKVFFYQHDLAPETMTAEFSTLNWNLSMGFLLSYDLYQTGGRGGLESDWLHLVGDVQKNLIAQYATERITGYSQLAPDVYQTNFETVDVTVNHSLSQTISIEDHLIAAEGSYIARGDGSLIGGYFEQLNGAPLAGDPHYLIIQQYADEEMIVVRQPLGEDTDLVIDPLAGWQDGQRLVVWGLDRDGNHVSRSRTVVENGALQFTYQTEAAGEDLGFYLISKSLLRKIPTAVEQDHLPVDLGEG